VTERGVEWFCPEDSSDQVAHCWQAVVFPCKRRGRCPPFGVERAAIFSSSDVTSTLNLCSEPRSGQSHFAGGSIIRPRTRIRVSAVGIGLNPPVALSVRNGFR
jgi:hypothetical protein